MSKGFLLFVRPDSLVICPEPVPNPQRRQSLRATRKTAPGALSDNSTRKLRRAVQWLSTAAPVRSYVRKKTGETVNWCLSFATLTFKNNMQDDNHARRILSSWLEMAKYRWMLTDYVWKAEPQERGAIHFHLVSNVYMPHAEVRYTWNRALRKEGLIKGDFNSVDVQPVESTNSIVNYVCEYLNNDNKHAGRRPIKGKLWGCSHNLSRAGKDYIYLNADDATVIDRELQRYSYYRQLTEEGKEIPDWLRHVNYYKLPREFYHNLPECEIKTMYMKTIETLNPSSDTRPGRQRLQLFDTPRG